MRTIPRTARPWLWNFVAWGREPHQISKLTLIYHRADWLIVFCAKMIDNMIGMQTLDSPALELDDNNIVNI